MSYSRSISATKYVVLAVLTLLPALPLCGCGSGNSSPVPINYHGDGTSGVRGVVTGYGISIGTTPKPIANATVSAYANNPSTTNTSSAGPPVEAKPQLGPVVAQAQTDAQGNYSLPLASGSYNIGVASSPSAGVNGSGGGYAAIPVHTFVEVDVVVNYGSP